MAVEQRVGLPDLPDLEIAHAGRLAFLDEPAHVRELRIGDVVASVAQGPYAHSAQHTSIQQDPELTVGYVDSELRRIGGKQAVGNGQTLEYLVGDIFLRVTCPVNVHAFPVFIQLHADERLVRPIGDAHDVQVGVHQPGVVAAQEDRGAGRSVGNVDIGRQDELRQEIGIKHLFGGADPFRAGERIAGIGFRSAGKGRKGTEENWNRCFFHGVILNCPGMS